VQNVAIIFGASRGIGAATAARYQATGFTVIATYRDHPGPAGTDHRPCDVTDPDAIRATLHYAQDTYGRCDVVVMNAGIVSQSLLVRLSRDELRRVFETNTFAAFDVVREAGTIMRRQKNGSIVLIASESAKAGIPGAAHYTASKAALEGLMRSAMWEYGPNGVRINVVSPGSTETDMFASVTDDNRQELLKRTPLRRFAQPDEIADAIFWVSQSTYLTGANIPVTGGEGLGC